MLDTPGLIPYHEGRRLNVSKQFLTDPARSTMEADTSAYVHTVHIHTYIHAYSPAHTVQYILTSIQSNTYVDIVRSLDLNAYIPSRSKMMECKFHKIS